jgi:hypothetical protein
MAKMPLGTPIMLDANEQEAYGRICTELLKRRARPLSQDAVLDPSVIEDLHCISPQLMTAMKSTKCLITSQALPKGASVVAILTEQTLAKAPKWPKRKSNTMRAPRHLLVGYIASEAVLRGLLKAGSIPPKEVQQRVGKTPKPTEPEIRPDQNECHCVQCGAKVFRAEDMKISTFVKTYRCQKCKEADLTFGSTRYCRSCAQPFSLSEGDGYTRRLCDTCKARKNST